MNVLDDSTDPTIKAGSWSQGASLDLGKRGIRECRAVPAPEAKAELAVSLQEKMVEIRSQAVEGGNEFTNGDIIKKVLGKRSGYVIGLCRAEVLPSQKARLLYNKDEVNQLRTEEQEQELNELRACKASQEEPSNAQQQMIDIHAKK